MHDKKRLPIPVQRLRHIQNLRRSKDLPRLIRDTSRLQVRQAGPRTSSLSHCVGICAHQNDPLCIRHADVLHRQRVAHDRVHHLSTRCSFAAHPPLPRGALRRLCPQEGSHAARSPPPAASSTRPDEPARRSLPPSAQSSAAATPQRTADDNTTTIANVRPVAATTSLVFRRILIPPGKQRHSSIPSTYSAMSLS